MTRPDLCKLMRSDDIAAVAVALTLLAFPATGLASTLDQQCTPPLDTGAEAFSNATFAQSFRAGISGPVEKASFYITTYWGSLQARVELRTVSGDGMPTGTTLARSAQVTAAPTWPTQATDFVFPSPATVTAGQSYALVGTGYVGVATRRCTDNTYAYGTYLANFGTWSEVSPGEDLTFATYIGAPSGGGQPPTPPSTQTPSVSTDFPKANGSYKRKRLKSIRGTLANAGSVRRVKVSVRRKRKSGKKCLWLARRSKLKKRSCKKPVYLSASGVSNWKVSLNSRQRRALKPGSYRLAVRLEDASGNQVDTNGSSSVSFKVQS